MDTKDERILDLLEGNSRIANTAIAAEIGISESAVRKRIANLERSGVIKRYTLELDPIALGFKAVAYIGLDTEPESYLPIVRELESWEEVRWLATSSGDHMVMAVVWSRNAEELHEFIETKLRSLIGVTRICPAIIHEKVK